MASATWVTLLNNINEGNNWTGLAGTALASSTTQTIISPSGPDLTFNLYAPPISLGQVIRVTAYGFYSTTGTPTLTLQLMWGGTSGTSLLTTGAVTTISGASNTSWRFSALLTCRSVGASGTLFCVGETLGIAAAGTAALLPATGATTATVDTTAQKSLTLTGTWGTSSASNTVTCAAWIVEGLC